MLICKERRVEKGRQPSPPPSLAWLPSGLPAALPAMDCACIRSLPHGTGQTLQLLLGRGRKDRTPHQPGEGTCILSTLIHAGVPSCFPFLPSPLDQALARLLNLLLGPSVHFLIKSSFSKTHPTTLISAQVSPSPSSHPLPPGDV